MPPKHVPPSIKRKAFSCPRCGALADQSWFYVQATSTKDTVFFPDQETLERLEADAPLMSDGNAREIHAGFISYVKEAMNGDIFFHGNGKRENGYDLKNLFASRCHSCRDLTIWRYDTILYPPTQYEVEPNEDLDNSIKADFNEARTILDLSPRGAAALLRLCVQKLCKQLGQPGKNINNDIAALVKNGLDPKVQQALDIVRVIGNEAVHPGTVDLNDNREVAATLFRLVNQIAYDMITRPKELDALYNSLPADKKDAIAKRDGKVVAAP